LILENLDAAYFIVPEYDFEGNKWLGVQKVKSRFFSMIESFYQPYTTYSPIKFVEDANNSVPVYKLTMRENSNLNNRLPGPFGNQNVVQYNVKEYNGAAMIGDDDDNVFTSSKAIGVYTSSAVASSMVAPMFYHQPPLQEGFIKVS
jgi:hypothetical protein